jgi:neutral ceramidase
MLLQRSCAFVLVFVLGLFASGARGETSWQAGCSKTIITPAELMWMAGYGSRDKPAEGKLTELWAKALVLQDDQGQRGVLITLGPDL